jgi:hypothetical protein
MKRELTALLFPLLTLPPTRVAKLWPRARVATAEEGGEHRATGPRGAEAHSIDQNKGADAMAAADHTARALPQGEGLARINPLL